MLDKSTTMLQAQQLEMDAEEKSSSSEAESESDSERGEEEDDENDVAETLPPSSDPASPVPDTTETPSTPVPLTNGRSRRASTRSRLAQSATPADSQGVASPVPDDEAEGEDHAVKQHEDDDESVRCQPFHRIACSEYLPRLTLDGSLR